MLASPRAVCGATNLTIPVPTEIRRERGSKVRCSAVRCDPTKCCAAYWRIVLLAAVSWGSGWVCLAVEIF
ncbi:hypothetical protein E2C01_100151 [Portunus trituberculatus]|uniref:Uncharacterized protein n=1 Tax=Portunus trituberculatus TaxID=210409 RepID=A0A5B7KBB1_PORTR|nr:hypothetical protein [Portunus trituberculatus]